MNSATFQRALRGLEDASAWAERKWPVLLAFYCILLLGSGVVLDFKKPFWNDELFTFYIARQPTFEGIWSVLMTGAEQLPPFFFLIERGFASMGGPSRLVFRLPETLGFLVMSLSIFWFVKRRRSALFGLVAPCLSRGD